MKMPRLPKPKRRESKKRIVGDIVRISLGDGGHTYACVLPDASFAFYDSRATEELTVQEVIGRPVLFFAAVMDQAVKTGRWHVVGHSSLDRLPRAPATFMQDQLKRDSFSIYENGQIRPATREQCAGLERAAVWEPEHVEERLRDHYAGRKNKWFELLKMVEQDEKTSPSTLRGETRKRVN